MEALELTYEQLRTLIVIYYTQATREQVRLTPEVEFLAERRLLFISHLSCENDYVTVRSLQRRSTLFLPGPSSAYCRVEVTTKGAELVARVDLSRRADYLVDACARGAFRDAVWCFVKSLSTGELPEFLSSSHPLIRSAAAARLDDCLSRTPTENFPELLTDSDPAVRATASAALNSHTHSA